MSGGRKQTCVCGCDLASHYRDPITGEICSCTVRGCDCKAYEDANAYKAKPRPALNAPYKPRSYKLARNKPHDDANCQCEACKEWFKNPDRKTDPSDTPVTPIMPWYTRP